MLKSELLKLVAAKAEVSQDAANRVLAAIEDVITENIAKKDETNLGFCKIKMIDKPERNCRNPGTGETIVIPARTVAKAALSSKFSGKGKASE